MTTTHTTAAADLREAAARKRQDRAGGAVSDPTRAAVADALREQGHDEPDADAEYLMQFLALRGMRVVAIGEGL